LDEFFQKLRDIQKKERSISGLARVGDDFYREVQNYLDKLIKSVDNDPFSLEHYLLRDTQRITTEICERREHKITDSAVMNVQRSYHLFKGKPKFVLHDTTPLNLTPEEEKLYFSLIEVLKLYREEIIPSIDLLSISEENQSDLETKFIKKSDIKDEPSIKPQLEPEMEIESEIARQGWKSSKKNVPNANRMQMGPLRTIMVFEEIPSIMGVDKNVYGPIQPQDVITIPEPNALILIKNKKGRFIQTYK